MSFWASNNLYLFEGEACRYFRQAFLCASQTMCHNKDMILASRSCLIGIIMIITFIIILISMGRIPWYEGGIGLWTWNPAAHETSQLFGDPYSFSHILHGVVFFWVLFLFRRKLPLDRRFLIAMLIEMAWEIWENTPFIIDRYRTATISLDYYGDSILNSCGDVIFCMLGFWFASRFSWKCSVVLFIAIELLMLYFIRDNLTLNILMLIYPIDAIRTWQAGT